MSSFNSCTQFTPAFGRIQIPVHRVNPLPWVIPAVLTVGTGIKSTSTTLNIRPPQPGNYCRPPPVGRNLHLYFANPCIPPRPFRAGVSYPLQTEVTPATDRYDPSMVASSLDWNLAMIIQVAKLSNGSGKHVN